MGYHAYVLLSLSCLTCYVIVQKIIAYVSARAFSKAHGCEPVHRIPQSERIIGYGYFKERMEAARNKTLLETTLKRYEEHGMTWSSTAMGRVFVNTIDPENIKAVLATNFNDFGLGHRLHTFGPLLGKGIFTTDGAHWEHSRVCANTCCIYLKAVLTLLLTGTGPAEFLQSPNPRLEHLRSPH